MLGLGLVFRWQKRRTLLDGMKDSDGLYPEVMPMPSQIKWY